MTLTLEGAIDQVTDWRNAAAREAIVFTTNTGKAAARGRAYAFQHALNILYSVDGAPPKPAHKPEDEMKGGGNEW